jgi:hypothetical protein
MCARHRQPSPNPTNKPCEGGARCRRYLRLRQAQRPARGAPGRPRAGGRRPTPRPPPPAAGRPRRPRRAPAPRRARSAARTRRASRRPPRRRPPAARRGCRAAQTRCAQRRDTGHQQTADLKICAAWSSFEDRRHPPRVRCHHVAVHKGLHTVKPFVPQAASAITCTCVSGSLHWWRAALASRRAAPRAPSVQRHDVVQHLALHQRARGGAGRARVARRGAAGRRGRRGRLRRGHHRVSVVGRRQVREGHVVVGEVALEVRFVLRLRAGQPLFSRDVATAARCAAPARGSGRTVCAVQAAVLLGCKDGMLQTAPAAASQRPATTSASSSA